MCICMFKSYNALIMHNVYATHNGGYGIGKRNAEGRMLLGSVIRKSCV